MDYVFGVPPRTKPRARWEGQALGWCVDVRRNSIVLTSDFFNAIRFVAKLNDLNQPKR